MKVRQITDKIEEKSPVSLAEGWDNVGLLVGTKEKEVKKIMLALDATDEVIEQAIKENVDLLITHHPMIFSGMKRVTDRDFIGRRIIRLIKNDISYYAMHTNCDVAILNDEAAKKIGLQSEEVLECTTTDAEGNELGIGKVGTLSKSTSVLDLAKSVKEKFHNEHIRITGDVEKKVSRVAVSTGSGKSMVKHAIKKKAEVLITGDIDHHTAIDALAQGVQIIDAGHFGTERFMVEYMYQYLHTHFGESIVVLKATEKDPFTTI